MVLNSARINGLLGAALAASLAVGCTIKTSSGDPESPPPPPPPAPTADPAPPPEEPTAEPAEQPKPASTVKVEGNKVSIPGNIVFDFGKSTLKEGAGSEVVLEQLKQYLEENKQVTKLRIEGHTDNVGKPEDNVKLSGERALTIKKWLVTNGVDAGRLLAVGFGEDKPVADNATDAGRAQNRRTEFRIAEIKGKAYMGQKDLTAGGKPFE